MMKKQLCLLFLLPLLSLAVSCQKDDVILKEDLAPVVSFDSKTYVYKVKLGREIVLTPLIENDIQATYSWKINGKVVAATKSYTYKAEAVSAEDIFAEFSVLTPYGSDKEEVRIDVVDLDKPVIGLAVPEGGYLVLAGAALVLDPGIDSSLETAYSWKVAGVEKSTAKTYTFTPDKVGKYELTLDVSNEDGADHLAFAVNAVLPEKMPFGWTFDQTEFSMAQGRSIRLAPQDIENAFEAAYKWEVDGVERQNSADPAFVFSGDLSGTYTLTVTMTNQYGSKSQALTVHVGQAEGAHRIPVDAASKADCNKVYAFFPAPGQFVNENYTCTTAAEAATYAKGRLDARNYVSLGGFGGSLVVGFDHSVANSGGYDIQVGSNYGGTDMSEPGVVWVMQDENGNGLPDDTWYELKGSEYGKPETVQEYAVTYYKPRTTGGTIAWKDNRGANGRVERNSYHKQEYFPLWVTAAAYTLRGTRLRTNAVESSPGYWTTIPFDWGYVDNPSTVDNLGMTGAYNHFRISDAVRFDGQPAGLAYIDFVKIQNGINAYSGALGEISTEVTGIRDYNLLK